MNLVLIFFTLSSSSISFILHILSSSSSFPLHLFHHLLPRFWSMEYGDKVLISHVSYSDFKSSLSLSLLFSFLHLSSLFLRLFFPPYVFYIYCIDLCTSLKLFPLTIFPWVNTLRIVVSIKHSKTFLKGVEKFLFKSAEREKETGIKYVKVIYCILYKF